jgi:hypothetical protein
MPLVLLWLCGIAGLQCGSPRPDASIIQAAYEREESSGDERHSKSLRLLDASCETSAADTYLCQVTFLSIDDPTQRRYYDVVIAARSGADWQLKSGLCKR